MPRRVIFSRDQQEHYKNEDYEEIIIKTVDITDESLCEIYNDFRMKRTEFLESIRKHYNGFDYHDKETKLYFYSLKY